MTSETKTRRATQLACRLRMFVAGAVAVAAVVATHAVDAATNSLGPAEQATVKKIGAYFNKLRTLQGEFVQVGPRGHVSEGVFYLSKPGKLRFEYAPPNPYLVVADGTWVIINNRRKNKADHYPLSQTPLRLVLAREVDLLEEAKITEVSQNGETLSMTMEDRGALTPGQLTVIFDAKTMDLKQWIITDGQGLRTTISLKSLKNGVKPDPKLFEVRVRNEIENLDRR